MKLKKMNNKWLKGIGIIGVIGCIAYGGYAFTSKEEILTETKSTVQEYTISKQHVSEVLTTSGIVQSASVEQLLGDVSSPVTNIYVEIGDQVTAGEILAELNPIDVQSDILNQEVVIANLEKEMKALVMDQGTSKKRAYENAKVALSNAKSTYESNQLLFENGAISQTDLGQALESYNKSLSDYESTKVAYDAYDYGTEYAILKKRLEVENKKLESLEQDILDHKVMASINGVVTALNIEEGEIPKESSVMMEIQDLSNLKIEASISEYEINDIEIGQSVTITTLGDDDKSYTGLVERIYPSGQVEGSEVFVTVVIDVEDEDRYLKPNFSANIDIETAEKSDALMVPYDALIKGANGYAVQLKGDDETTKKLVRVETGIESDLTIEVVSDELREGTVILVASEVDLGTVERQGGMMIPGMGGPGAGGSGQGTKRMQNN